MVYSIIINLLNNADHYANDSVICDISHLFICFRHERHSVILHETVSENVARFEQVGEFCRTYFTCCWLLFIIGIGYDGFCISANTPKS